MTTARQELRDLIAAKMSDRLAEMGSEFIGEERLADAVMELFHSVEDDWDSIDVSTLGDLPGSRFLDQRSLVVRIPRESRERVHNLTPDRTVTP